MIYQSLKPKGPPPAKYEPFLSAIVLRQHIGYPRQTLVNGAEE